MKDSYLLLIDQGHGNWSMSTYSTLKSMVKAIPINVHGQDFRLYQGERLELTASPVEE